MKSLCLFAAYFSGDEIPYYIKIYLTELKKHFTEVILLTGKNVSPLSSDFLVKSNLKFENYDNSGFDFGLWHKSLQQKDVSEFDRLALINDSCILFKPLDEFMKWANENRNDVLGMTISYAIAPHVQSYFLLFNKKAIPPTLNYFKEHGVYTDISDVIKNYEVGLSVYLSQCGLSQEAFVDNDNYRGEFSPYYHCVEHHLKTGIPLLKKKILFQSYRKDELLNLARMGFNISVKYYSEKIRANNPSLLIDFEKLISEHPSEMNGWQVFKYNSIKNAIQLFRPFYKLIKRV